MLLIINKFSQLSFPKLVQVYTESLTQNFICNRSCSPNEQMREAEQDFYDYLRFVFFRQNHSRYAIWEERGRYVSALRLEAYMDGYLICALETAPEYRRLGFAEKLMTELLRFLSDTSTGKLYSHISNSNAASLELHQKCGFQIIKDYAKFLDGSVYRDHVTMLYEFGKTES